MFDRIHSANPIRDVGTRQSAGASSPNASVSDTVESDSAERRNFLRTAAVVLIGAIANVSPRPAAHRHGRDPADQVWRDFEGELADTLSGLAEGQFLILVKQKTNRYAQFLSRGTSGMRIETTSNVFLNGAERLSTNERRRLVGLGWRSPAMRRAGSPNFYRDIPCPVPFRDVASLAIRTLRGIHDVAHPGGLEYQSGSHGQALVFPSLALKHYERA